MMLYFVIVAAIVAAVMAAKSKRQTEGLDKIIERRRLRMSQGAQVAGRDAPEGVPPGDSLAGTDSGDGPARTRQWWQKPVFIGSVAGVVLAAGIGWMVYDANSKPREVVIVNGSGAGYSVVVDGVAYELPESGPVLKLECKPGDHVVEATFAGAGEAVPLTYSGTFNVSADDWVTVINPDRLAVIYSQSIKYNRHYKYLSEFTPESAAALMEALGQSRPSIPRKSAADPDIKIHANAQIYKFPRPHYLFEPPAKAIPIFGGDDPTQARRLIDIARDATPAGAAGIIELYNGRKAMLEYLMECGRRNPKKMSVLDAAEAWLNPDEAREFFAMHLDTSPAIAEWHLTRVLHARNHSRDAGLVSDYKARLEKNPGDGALLYIMGWLTSDFEEKTDYWRRAASAPVPCASAHWTLGEIDWLAGRFADALARLERAEAGQVPFPTRLRKAQLLLAVGRVGEALEEGAAACEAMPADLDCAKFYLGMLGSSGAGRQGEARADKIIQDYRDAIRKENGPAYAELSMDAHVLRFFHAYGSGDEALSLAMASFLQKDTYFQWLVALMRRHHQEARDGIARVEANAQLLLPYIVAMRSGDDTAADLALSAAIPRLRADGSAWIRLVAGCIEDKNEPSKEAVQSMLIAPDEKRVLFCALGWRFPENRETYFAEARRNNYNPVFPKWLLEKSMSENKIPVSGQRH
jgi:tetratricopeptide (TPR) repeat protein